MEIRIEREWFSKRSTMGTLFIDGKKQCVTLEPPVHGRLIPEGRYECFVRWSPHFKRNVIGIRDVPGFSDVEMHCGNSPEDTKACTVIGSNAGIDFVSNSHAAYTPLFAIVDEATRAGVSVFVTYENRPGLDSPLQPPFATENATVNA